MRFFRLDCLGSLQAMSFSSRLELEDSVRHSADWRERVEGVNGRSQPSAAGGMRRALHASRLERILDHTAQVPHGIGCDEALLKYKEEARYLIELELVCSDAEIARSVEPFDRGLLFGRPGPGFSNLDGSRVSTMAPADHRRVERALRAHTGHLAPHYEAYHWNKFTRGTKSMASNSRCLTGARGTVSPMVRHTCYGSCTWSLAIAGFIQSKS